MIYLLYGVDAVLISAKIRDIVASFLKSGASSGAVFKIDDDNFNSEEFENLLRAEGIFDKKRLIIAKYVLSDKEIAKIILNILSRTKNVPGITVVFREADMKMEEIKPFKAYLDKIKKYDSNKNTEFSKNFNIFGLTDAMSEKNKKLSFFLYHSALNSGLVSEEIFWNIYRQFKNMLLVEDMKNKPSESISKKTGLHPYVVKKCSSFLKNFTEEELKNSFEHLVSLWVDARLKNRDLSIGLEAFLLSARESLCHKNRVGSRG